MLPLTSHRMALFSGHVTDSGDHVPTRFDSKPASLSAMGCSAATKTPSRTTTEPCTLPTRRAPATGTSNSLISRTVAPSSPASTSRRVRT